MPHILLFLQLDQSCFRRQSLVNKQNSRNITRMHLLHSITWVKLWQSEAKILQNENSHTLNLISVTLNKIF